MRVCVYGAGAVGGHLAARLLEAGAEVSVLTRGEHLRAIRARGLTLCSGGERIVVAPRAASDDPTELGPQDLVFVTLKAPELPGHAGAIAAMLAADGAAAFVTNGIPWWWNHGLAGRDGPLPLLDPEHRLWEGLGPGRAIGCVVHSTNEIVAPGVIAHRARNRWICGEPDGSASARLAALFELAAPSRLGTERGADIRAAVWEKLVQNVAVSGLAALTRLQTEEIATDRDLGRLCSSLAGETLVVAAAQGWELRGAIDPELTRRSFEVPGVTPSMLQDVLRGRSLEVDAILGQTQAFGREAGVATPTLDIVLALLRGLDRGRRRD